VRDVRSRLVGNGASSAFAERVVRGVRKSGARGAYAIDAAARLLGAAFRIQPSPKRGVHPLVIAFVGPTGAGKTSSLAKLGRRLADSGRRVAFASFDQTSALETVGGVHADVDRAEIPLIPVRNAADVRRLLRRAGEYEVVLLDTVGFIRELPPALMQAFSATLEEVGEADLLLHVVDATDPDADQHIRTVDEILGELDAEGIDSFIVFNKCDRLEPRERREGRERG